MMILSVDTSSAEFSVALLEEGMLIDEFESDSPNQHSSSLIPAIDRLLSKNCCDIEKIDAFCVGLGPGSFTGLRVGITTMRALALALKKPIAGVTSIDSLAYNLLGYEGNICAIIDAKQKKVYARVYNCKGKKITPCGKYLLLKPDELMLMIKKPTMFIGDAIALYRGDIIKAAKIPVNFAPEAAWYPKAAIVAKLGWQRIKSGKKDNVFSLLPLYIYPKECQARKHRS